MASSVRQDASHHPSNSSSGINNSGLSGNSNSGSKHAQQLGKQKQQPGHALRYTAKQTPLDEPNPAHGQNSSHQHFASLTTTDSHATQVTPKKWINGQQFALEDHPSLVYHSKEQSVPLAANLFSSSENNEEEQADDLGDGDPLTCGDSDFEPAEQSISSNQLQYGKSQFEFDPEAQHLTLLGSTSPFHYSLERKLESEHGTTADQTSLYSARYNNNYDRYYPEYNQKNPHDIVAQVNDAWIPDQTGNSKANESIKQQDSLRQNNSQFRSKYAKLQQDARKNSDSYPKTGFAATSLSKYIAGDTLKNTSNLKETPATTLYSSQLGEDQGEPPVQYDQSSTIRRFARGTYNSKQQRQPPIQLFGPNLTQQQNDRSGQHQYYMKKQQRDDSSEGSPQQTQQKLKQSWDSDDETQFLIPSSNISGGEQHYWRQKSNQKTEFEMKELKKKPFVSADISDDGHESNSNSSSGQNQCESQYSHKEQRSSAQNIAYLKQVQQQQDKQQAEVEGNRERNQVKGHPSSIYKSTAVGFSPDLNKNTGAQNKQSSATKDNIPAPTRNTDSGMRLAGMNQTSAQKAKNAIEINTQQNKVETTYNNFLKSPTPSLDQFSMMYPQKQQKEPWQQVTQQNQSAKQAPATQKDKKKKKKDQSNQSHFLLTGPVAHLMENRSFFKNKDEACSGQFKDGTPAQLRQWFDSLSVQDRVNSLTTTYPLFVNSFINVMQRHVRPHGPLCLFTIKKEKQQTEDIANHKRRQGAAAVSESDQFIFEYIVQQDYQRYNPYPQGGMVRETQTSLLKYTRITSNKADLDTITVCQELVKSSEGFFQLMADVTDSTAFSESIQYCTRSGSGGKPVIESPKWVDRNSQNYLAVWIAVILEETLWAHFNYSNQVNIASGIRKNELNNLFELRSDNLQQQEDLANRWVELGAAGHQKLVDALRVKAKEETPSKFQEMYEEIERRNPVTMYPFNVSQRHEELYGFQYQNMGSRYGYYQYQEMHVHSDDIGQMLDGFKKDPESSISRSLLSYGGDVDLKEILDVVSYLNPLEMIKYLSEVPLQEINQKNYIRKHHLQRELHLLIQADLRQSIQDALMNDLLNSESKDVKRERDEASLDKKRKKRKGGGQQSADIKKKEGGKQVAVKAIAITQRTKDITISDEEELTADGTGASSSGANTTIGAVTTSDDNTSQAKPPHFQDQQQFQEVSSNQAKKVAIKQQQQSQPQKSQKKKGAQAQQAQSTQIDSYIRSQILEQLLISVFDEIQNKEELQKKLEIEEKERMELELAELQKQEAAVEDSQADPVQQTAQKSRRKRKTGKKQDAEELMNNFMRKLHGADDDADTSGKKANAGSKNDTHGNAKDKKAATGALPKSVKTVPEGKQSGRNQTKGGSQINTKIGDSKPRLNQSGEKTKQSSIGKRKNRSPKGESEKSSDPIPQEEPIKVLPDEVIEEIVITEVKPEVIVTNTENQEEEPVLVVQPIKEKINLKDQIFQRTNFNNEIQDFNLDFFESSLNLPKKQIESAAGYDNQKIIKINYEEPNLTNITPEENKTEFLGQKWTQIELSKLAQGMSTTSNSFTPTQPVVTPSQSDKIAVFKTTSTVFNPANVSPNISPPTNQSPFNISSQFLQVPQIQHSKSNFDTFAQDNIYGRGVNQNFGFKQDGGNLVSDFGSQYSHQQDYHNAPHHNFQPGPKINLNKKQPIPFRGHAHQTGQHSYYTRSPTSLSTNQQFSVGSSNSGSNESLSQVNSGARMFNYNNQKSQGGRGYISNASPEAHQDLNLMDSVIRINAPSFEPSKRVEVDWQKVEHSDQNSSGGKEGFLPDQDPLFLATEDAFYQKFDRDIIISTHQISIAIESHAEERAYVLNKIQELAFKAFPGSKPVIKVFGSLMTGLALVSSDMDMAVTGLTICDRASMIDDMHSLADQLRKWDLIADLKAIETASIPVIKANISLAKITKEMGRVRQDGEIEQMLPIDITFDDSPSDSTNGVQKTNQDYNILNGGGGLIPGPLQSLISGEFGFNFGADPIMGFGLMDFGGPPQPKTHLGLASCTLLKDYVKTYPCLRDVAILLKRFLAENDLNSAYQGGISSYSAVLLIIAYMNNFQLHHSPHLTPSRLLMGFLDFYSNCFDPRLYGINTTNGKSFYPLPQVNQQMFVIVDPVNPSNNTARNSYRTPDVLAYFRAAFRSLKSLVNKQYQLALKPKQTPSSGNTQKMSEQQETVARGQVAMQESAVSASGASPVDAKIYGTAGDGAGLRKKKLSQQEQSLDPAAKRAQEKQHLQKQASSSTGVTTTGANDSPVLSREASCTHAFDSVNFVGAFLASEIMQKAADEQGDEIVARSGFGAFQ